MSLLRDLFDLFRSEPDHPATRNPKSKPTTRKPARRQKTIVHPIVGEVTLSQSRQARRISLCVRPSGPVRLSYPYGVSTARALEFLEALPLAQPMRYVASQPWLESYDKQGGLLFTEMLLFLARDVLLWQNGLEEQIYNCDCTDRLRRLAASWPASHLKQAADIAQQAYQAIESNAGAKLVLETVVLKTDILRKEER
jgi:hypothetical protein